MRNIRIFECLNIAHSLETLLLTRCANGVMAEEKTRAFLGRFAAGAAAVGLAIMLGWRT